MGTVALTMSDATSPPLPPTAGVVALPGSTLTDRLLVGGSPRRRVELTTETALVVAGLLGGATVADVSGRTGASTGSVGSIARRLVQTAVAGPVPAPASEARPAIGDVAAVIPAHDAEATLQSAIASLRGVAEVVVVDDGSRDATADVAAAAGARVLRNDRPRGPAAARNRGIAATSTDLVVVLDADARPRPGWLDVLLAHLDDPMVGGVAPRIVGMEDGSTLGAYEVAAGPLDLGPWPAVVRPDGPVTFVSTTALLLRRSLWENLGGFDEGLRFGEDLDFAWRAAAEHQPLVHEPAAVVEHHHRAELSALLRNRRRYGSAAGVLSRRHPGHPRAAVAPPLLTGAAVAAVAGLPRTAAVLATASAAVTAHQLSSLGTPPLEVAEEALRSTLGSARGLAAAVSRPWLPVALGAAALRRRSRPAVVAAVLGRMARHRPAPGAQMTAGSWWALRFLDDLAFSTGVLQGCLAARTALPLANGRPPGPRRTTTVLGTEVVLP